MKNKITRVECDKTFDDILINVGVVDVYDEYKIEVKTSDSSEPFSCEPFQKISDILEFNNNFKIINISLNYKETDAPPVATPKRKRDGFSYLMENARAMKTPKKKKETNGKQMLVVFCVSSSSFCIS